MESKEREKRIIYLGYLLLLFIPLIQNDLRFIFNDKSFILNIVIGSLPSFIATFSICSLGLLIFNKFNFGNKHILYGSITFILISYEFFQISLENLYFDYFDILFTLIGYLVFLFTIYFRK